jgi:hypothetical protein
MAMAAFAQIGPASPDSGRRVSLAAELRPAYPGLEVHRQATLAHVQDDDVWYAFQDGRRADTDGGWSNATDHGDSV